jgi:hypothetical protein
MVNQTDKINNICNGSTRKKCAVYERNALFRRVIFPQERNVWEKRFICQHCEIKVQTSKYSKHKIKRIKGSGTAIRKREAAKKE